MLNYESPLFSFFSKIRGNNVNLGYTGNLHQVLENLKNPQTFNTISRLTPFNYTQNQVDIAFHPPRIIQKLLDFKIEEPSKNRQTCLVETIKGALCIYQNPKTAITISDYLDSIFKKHLSASNYEDLMFSRLIQKIDDLSLKSSSPNLSLENSNNLMRLTNNSDILLIALGSGGIMPGMDIYLNYVNKLKKLGKPINSIFQPVRFSRYKLEDKAPRLSLEEICHLESLSKDKKIVIFDEDCCSGETLDIAKDFFEDLTNRKDLICFANDSIHKGYDISYLTRNK